MYFNTETNGTEAFENFQIILLKYNSPLKRGLAISIGKMYFENKGYNYDSHPDMAKAELLLINANSTSTYSEFTGDYYYQIPLPLTPFDTEFNAKFKAVKIPLNLTSLFDSEGVSELEFSNIVFSVPNPNYEFTISEVVLLKSSYEPTDAYGSSDSRVWQYSEVEEFIASESPEEDSYQLTLEKLPIFYPEIDWLDYLNIYDEEGNYYSAGVTGNDHQLHFEPSNNTFTWNPSFNQYPEYFGMEFEEPLIIAPNKTLYFEFATNTSWKEPIRIEEANIDLDSLRVVYDYNYLLKPEHYDWLVEFGTAHSYENIAYSFMESPEYRVVQYYYETFTVYSEVSEYTYEFDIGNLTFNEDFANISIYSVSGLTPTLE